MIYYPLNSPERKMMEASASDKAVVCKELLDISERLKTQDNRMSGKRTTGSLKRRVRALQRALRDIRDWIDPHIGERGEDVSQYPECFCIRCIAVRALRPNGKLKRGGD